MKLLAVVAPLLFVAAPPAPLDTARGDRLLERYFRAQVRQISEHCLADITSRADWEQQLPERRRQFLDMLGLWPLPTRTDLHATITGTVDTDLFTVEKLHFQSWPGLYVTANLYLPRRAKGPLPAVLYVCGHSPVVVDGVPYGNKVTYQNHASWYASHGYVCLVLDTLQLGEVPGLHHGTHHLGLWWWQTVGYTPAGVECWNAMRAIDYLLTRKEVDPRRIGVSGRSGGGATSWWVTAADERVACAVPVAGLADLQAHVVEGATPALRDGVIAGHCDCMYFINSHRWDFAEVIALCAPRPVLLGNSDVDDIFPVPGYRRPAVQARRIYHILGADDRFSLLETAGPHSDTAALREGEYRWMNRWLNNDTGPFAEGSLAKLTPQQLKVFATVPADAINREVHELFHKPANPEIPRSPEVARAWWEGTAPQWREILRGQVFAGWPARPVALNLLPATEETHDGLHLRSYDFMSEEAVGLRLWLLTAEGVERPSQVILHTLDEPSYRDLVNELGPAFAGALQTNISTNVDIKRLQQTKKTLSYYHWAFAFVAPRGIGPTRWSAVGPDSKPNDQHIRRRFALLGQTLDGQRVYDLRRAIAAVRALYPASDVPLSMEGHGEMSVLALYATLFEPTVSRVDLWQPPASHRDGPTFLNIRRYFDLPQAIALALPREVHLHVKSGAEAPQWDWPMALQKALGGTQIRLDVNEE